MTRRKLFSLASRPRLGRLSSTFKALGRLLRVVPLPKAKAKPAPKPKPSTRQRTATATTGPAFTRHVLTAGGHRHSFHLFTPSLRSRGDDDADGRLPLLVMLHGCKQDGPDFATGTRMNAEAERLGLLVVYPGGAMALTTAHQFPELFAAVGVHSGLPQGAAISAGGALAAMRSGAAMALAARASTPLPTIVFHGTHDRVVHPANGSRIVAQALAAFAQAGRALAEPASDTANTPARSVYTDAAGRPQVESWQLRGVGHAWSGGDAAGGFTAPSGPDASAALMKFLLQQRREG